MTMTVIDYMHAAFVIVFVLPWLSYVCSKLAVYGALVGRRKFEERYRSDVKNGN